ncbi:acyl-CoA dehydrogenase family protein [Streptomyces sp. P9-2B-2]|uniref:acyl-CoA dehydrogenase family protein n=1 Tax=Streptomyces sp. P9-2B-2 TaxID=3057114 RepID=UPI0025B3A29E|nr:acyl-CoA dehydrogenase family protein [Streptomyces sp. P9-2B-2]WJY36506.1 acyl-CoA dehydrogenase family protein [Streptomyces sp. P9-2B-2]
MRFLLTDEQREFAHSLDGMLSTSGTPAVARAWAAGDHQPGRALWKRIARTGVFGLAVPEQQGGSGLLPVELALSYVELGRHAVPGPLVETVAAAAFLERLGADAEAKEWLPRIASGGAVLSLCAGAGPYAPYADAADPTYALDANGPARYALDADAADAVLVIQGDTVSRTDTHGPVQSSLDPARRLARPLDGTVLVRGPVVAAAAAHAVEVARLLTAAQSLGLGRALLAATVSYVQQRTQFGSPIGSFQAVKHRLADTLIGLEFAQPLVHAAALALAAGAPSAGREVAAAKVAAGEAGYAAARTALQLHGAIGYTEELDLSLWIRKARPLRDAWGTPAACRARVLTG